MSEQGAMPDKSEEGLDALGIAMRQVLAIAGAFSLLHLIKDFMTWQHDIGLWIDAFRASHGLLQVFFLAGYRIY